MRFSVILLSIAFLTHLTGWETDFENAKARAVKEQKLILLNFSGSDWCGPCIRLEKDVFENSEFKNYADANLVLVNADFPRLKKNQLSKAQQKSNDALAEIYNSQGIFPKTLLIDARGSVIKEWEGNPGLTAEQFIGKLKEIIDVRK